MALFGASRLGHLQQRVEGTSDPVAPDYAWCSFWTGIPTWIGISQLLGHPFLSGFTPRACPGVVVGDYLIVGEKLNAVYTPPVSVGSPVANGLVITPAAGAPFPGSVGYFNASTQNLVCTMPSGAHFTIGAPDGSPLGSTWRCRFTANTVFSGGDLTGYRLWLHQVTVVPANLDAVFTVDTYVTGVNIVDCSA